MESALREENIKNHKAESTESKDYLVMIAWRRGISDKMKGKLRNLLPGKSINVH